MKKVHTIATKECYVWYEKWVQREREKKEKKRKKKRVSNLSASTFNMPPLIIRKNKVTVRLVSYTKPFVNTFHKVLAEGRAGKSVSKVGSLLLLIALKSMSCV